MQKIQNSGMSDRSYLGNIRNHTTNYTKHTLKIIKNMKRISMLLVLLISAYLVQAQSKPDSLYYNNIHRNELKYPLINDSTNGITGSMISEGVIIDSILNNSLKLPDDFRMKNDSVRIVLKTLDITHEPKFALCYATAIYSKTKHFYLEYPPAPTEGSVIISIYILPIKKSVVNRDLIKIVLDDGRNFNLKKYHEIIKID